MTYNILTQIQRKQKKKRMLPLCIVLFIIILTKIDGQLTNNYCISFSNPCMNGGVCVSIYPNTFRCNCASGFTGSLCDYPQGNI